MWRWATSSNETNVFISCLIFCMLVSLLIFCRKFWLVWRVHLLNWLRRRRRLCLMRFSVFVFVFWVSAESSRRQICFVAFRFDSCDLLFDVILDWVLLFTTASFDLNSSENSFLDFDNSDNFDDFDDFDVSDDFDDDDRSSSDSISELNEILSFLLLLRCWKRDDLRKSAQLAKRRVFLVSWRKRKR